MSFWTQPPYLPSPTPAVPQLPAPFSSPPALPASYSPGGGGGILDLIFGANNPLSQFVDSRHNTFSALGAGLAQGPDFASGLSKAAQLVPQGRAADQEAMAKNRTIEMIRNDPKYSFLADAITPGSDIGPVVNTYMQAKAADRVAATDLARSQTFAKTLGDPNGDNGDVIAALNAGDIKAPDAFKVINDRRKAGSKPPTVVEQYDPATGQPEKMVWDTGSASFKPFGGPKAPAGNPADDDNVQQISDAIISGDQPPTLTGLYHLAGPVRAALAKKGYNLTTATQDYTATTRLLSTMNGPQQVRLRQATQQVADQLQNVRGLADQWKAGGLKPLNALTRKAAEQGVLGPQAQSIVTKLDSAIADMTAELGSVYMGGNTPTDHSLALAAQNLDADWSDTTLQDNLDQLDKNLGIRLNSLRLSTGGIGNSSQYNPMTNSPGGTPTVPIAGQSPGAADYKSRYGLE